MRPVADPQAFRLDLALGPVPASPDEVRHEIGSRLDDFDPSLVLREADLWVSLTVTAQDLWHAVLMAMAAVTATGYPVVQLEAQTVAADGPEDPPAT